MEPVLFVMNNFIKWCQTPQVKCYYLVDVIGVMDNVHKGLKRSNALLEKERLSAPKGMSKRISGGGQNTIKPQKARKAELC